MSEDRAIYNLHLDNKQDDMVQLTEREKKLVLSLREIINKRRHTLLIIKVDKLAFHLYEAKAISKL